MAANGGRPKEPPAIRDDAALDLYEGRARLRAYIERGEKDLDELREVERLLSGADSAWRRARQGEVPAGVAA